MNHGGIALLSLAAGLALVPAAMCKDVKAADAQDWVPYTATYTEQIANPGSPKRTLVWTEERASDGSLLSVERDGTRAIGGRLWRGSGQVYSLDFDNRTAVFQRDSPRIHLAPHGEAVGSATIANVACALYPVKVVNGTGSICIDAARDILVREEIHSKSSQGDMDYVRELTSIDFSAPRAGQAVGFPSGLTVLAPPQQ